MIRLTIVTRLAERPDLPRGRRLHRNQGTRRDERQPLRSHVQIFVL